MTDEQLVAAIRAVGERHDALVETGMRMRAAQRSYFREARAAGPGRKRELMAEAKAAEAAFDRLLAEVAEGGAS